MKHLRFKEIIKAIIVSFALVGSYVAITFFAIEGARPYGYFTMSLIGILLVLGMMGYGNCIIYGSLFFNPLEKFRKAFGKSK